MSGSKAESLGNVSLVIGGTGMLASATRWLIGRSKSTVLVARRATRFALGDPRITPLDLDWGGSGFRPDMTSALIEAGPIDSALLWLHDPAPILGWLAPLLTQTRVVLVLGSLDGIPPIPDCAAAITTVRLGSKATSGGGRRWLTGDEISAAAISVLSDGRSRVVGELMKA